MGRHEKVAELAGLGAPAGSLLASGPTAGRRVVADLGCGQGRTVRALLAAAGAGSVVHALDQVSALPEDLLADPRVRSRIVDLDEPLPLADGSLDAAVSLNVLEHLADPRGHLVDVHRVLRPGGVLVLAHSDWDTALFTSTDDALTRTLVDRFVASAPTRPGREGLTDGFMGRKLLAHAAASGLRDAPWGLVDVTSWADAHRRFDVDSVAWKVATGMLAAARGDAVLAARAAGWMEELRRIAAAGQFLFTVTDVAVVLQRP